MFAGEGIYWIRNKSLSSRFIDILNNPYVHGGERSSMPIELLSPRLTRPQLWFAEQAQDGESFIFHNCATDTVLDIDDGSSTQGASIIVRPYASTGGDASSQHWQVVQVSDDNNIPYYRIVNQKTKTVLDQTRKTRHEAEFCIESWNFNGGQHQLWVFERATFPTMYWIVNISSNQCLQYSSSPSNTASLDFKTKRPSRNQLWYLESLVDFDGYYRIRNVESEDRVLDLAGFDNATILGWNIHEGENQRWKITGVDMNGVVSIVCDKVDAVLYAKPDRKGVYSPRGASNASTFDSHCQWSLSPCTIPSLFSTAAKCRGSGKLAAQSGGSITAFDVALNPGSGALRDALNRWQLRA
ncbi:ricin B lectin domain-containing protein [Pisolithus marmoratus]|nr:ricin B lectin domain-containing protein [Pisolithus marmoratus]